MTQAHIPKDFTVAVEDDALIRRRMWTPEGIRPIVTVTVSHPPVYLVLQGIAEEV